MCVSCACTSLIVIYPNFLPHHRLDQIGHLETMPNELLIISLLLYISIPSRIHLLRLSNFFHASFSTAYPLCVVCFHEAALLLSLGHSSEFLFYTVVYQRFGGYLPACITIGFMFDLDIDCILPRSYSAWYFARLGPDVFPRPRATKSVPR
jgi:hypothetical protein